jgi:hypothetical protein
MEVLMSQRTRSGLATSRLGALFSRTSLVHSGPRDGQVQLSGSAVPISSEGWAGTARAAITSHQSLVLIAGCIALAGMVLVGALLVFHPHVDLLQSALGTTNKKPTGGGADVADTNRLWGSLNKLTTEADYLVFPSVTLAGGVGAAFMAFGHRKGAPIISGAVIAGVIGGGLKVIVQ